MQDAGLEGLLLSSKAFLTFLWKGGMEIEIKDNAFHGPQSMIKLMKNGICMVKEFSLQDSVQKKAKKNYFRRGPGSREGIKHSPRVGREEP